ncbi:MAG: ChaN family lipoprotein, partial [Deltaproteobacteria bacterium]|nr:ChaN family lipoprotein [Deltaproteobacteria bacterium]
MKCWSWAALVLLLSVQVGCSMSGVRHRPGWISPYRDIQSLQPGQIIHLPTGVLVTRDQLIDMLFRSQIVYVGEIHDNVRAHEVELEVLQCLYERLPDDIAVGMEMLTRPSQDVCNAWISGELDEKTFFKTWVEDWTNDYLYYKDILDYVREHHIPLVALRASKDWVERVKHDQPGVQPSEDEDDTVEPLPDLDVEDSYHRSQIKAVFKAHPRHGEDFE